MVSSAGDVEKVGDGRMLVLPKADLKLGHRPQRPAAKGRVIDIVIASCAEANRPWVVDQK